MLKLEDVSNEMTKKNEEINNLMEQNKEIKEQNKEIKEMLSKILKNKNLHNPKAETT